MNFCLTMPALLSSNSGSGASLERSGKFQNHLVSYNVQISGALPLYETLPLIYIVWQHLNLYQLGVRHA